MISPDAANLGVKAVYVWAGLLVPTVVILWAFYPEVRGFPRGLLYMMLTVHRRTAGHTGNLTSFMRERFQRGDSKIPRPYPNGKAKRIRLWYMATPRRPSTPTFRISRRGLALMK